MGSTNHRRDEPFEGLWELVPEDGDTTDPVAPAEVDAMHVVAEEEASTRAPWPTAPPAPPPPPRERPWDVEELLERQHYALPAERADESSDAASPGERPASAIDPHPGRPPIRIDESEAAALLGSERDRLRTLRRMLLDERATQAGDEIAGHHPADLASDTYDHEVDDSLLASVDAELVEVAAAEKRLAGHIYGWCERCWLAIPRARLQAEPATRWCLKHGVEAADERF